MTQVSSGDISVSVARMGADVEVRISISNISISGNYLFLNGGAELIPPGLRPAWQSPGWGVGNRPGVAILPVAWTANTNGSITLFKDPAITESFSGVIRYLLA